MMDGWMKEQEQTQTKSGVKIYIKKICIFKFIIIINWIGIRCG